MVGWSDEPMIKIRSTDHPSAHPIIRPSDPPPTHPTLSMKSAVKIPLLLLPGMLLSGCFSLGTTIGGINGQSPSKAARSGALAADVVTLPLQVLVLGVREGLDSGHDPEASPRLIARIKANPEYLFEHQLHLKNSYSSEFRSVEHALLDPQIPFTEAQLWRLYREMQKDGLHYLAHNARCPEALLRELFALSKPGSGQAGYAIAHRLMINPSLPEDLLAVADGDPTWYDPAVLAWAREARAKQK
jgi:hypothetical protein